MSNERTEQLNAVMARVASGDESSFAELYDKVAGPVFGTVLKVIRSRELAEEVTHDVFLEVWQKARAWNPDRGSAAAFILTMARARAIDRVRSEESRKARDERVGRAAFERPDDHVEREVIAGMDVLHARTLLSRLSEIQREVVELSFFGGFTQAAISERLGIPVGTVKSRMHSALRAMRGAEEVT